MDVLFYKVIHNKYLFNLIFNHIYDINDSLINNYQPNQININNNRIKFKNIKSLSFIINHKLYSLLKYKLKYNEFIQLDCSLVPWINELDNKVEIFNYFLNNSSIRNLEYINGCLLDLDSELIEIACSEPYSIQILYSKLNYVGVDNYQKILDLFFKYNSNNIQLIQDFKNKSVKLNFESSILEIDQFLQILLNNNQYYNIPITQQHTISSTSSNDSSSVKKVKIDKILFDLQSTEIQNKLLDLKYYKYSEESKPYQDEIERIISNSGGCDRILKLLNLFRSNCINSEIWFTSLLERLDYLKLYLSNNKNDWKKFQKELVSNYKGWKSLDPEFIKYYLSLEGDQDYGFFICSVFSEDIVKKINSYLMDDISNSLDNNNNNSNGNNSNSNSNSNKNNKNLQIFLDIVKSAPINNNIIAPYRQILEKSHYKLFKDKIVISDIESIDLILNHGIGYNNFVYSNLDLIKYLKRKVKAFSLPAPSSIFGYIAQTAFNTLDLDLIKAIESELGGASYFYKHLDLGIVNLNISQENFYDKEFNQILGYLISNNEIEGAFKVLGLFPSDSNYYSSNLSIALSTYSKSFIAPMKSTEDHYRILSSWIKLFVKCCSSFSVRKLQILLNHGFNPIINYPALFLKKENSLNLVSNLIYTYLDQKLIQHSLKDATVQDVFKIIEILIKSLRNHINQDNLSVIQTFINELYKRFIQIPNVKFSSLYRVYSLIKSMPQIVISHSIFHSLYYLLIRSPKLIKYIVEFPTFKDGGYSVPNRVVDYSKISKYSFPDKYFKPDIFTFEFIFKDQLKQQQQQFQQQNLQENQNGMETNEDLIIKELLKLSYSFISCIINCSQDQQIKFILEHNLNYLIEINKLELFSNELVFIIKNNSSLFNGIYKYFSNNFILQVYGRGLISELLKYQDHIKEKDNLIILNQILELNQHQHQQYSKDELFFMNGYYYYRIEFSIINFLIKYHSIIFGNGGIKSSMINDFSLSCCFRFIPFKLYSDLRKLYPNEQRLQISESIIDELVKSGHIIFLRELYQHNFINNKSLLYLKSILINHKEYKYINWLQ